MFFLKVVLTVEMHVKLTFFTFNIEESSKTLVSFTIDLGMILEFFYLLLLRQNELFALKSKTFVGR